MGSLDVVDTIRSDYHQRIPSYLTNNPLYIQNERFFTNLLENIPEV
jgi:hypothetical protein